MNSQCILVSTHRRCYLEWWWNVWDLNDKLSNDELTRISNLSYEKYKFSAFLGSNFVLIQKFLECLCDRIQHKSHSSINNSMAMTVFGFNWFSSTVDCLSVATHSVAFCSCLICNHNNVVLLTVTRLEEWILTQWYTFFYCKAWAWNACLSVHVHFKRARLQTW